MKVLRPEVPVESDAVGPNGGRIEVMENGDRVEWVTEEDGEEYAYMLLRGRDSIGELYEDLWDLVSSGRKEPPPTVDREESVRHWERQAEKIEKKWDLGPMTLEEFDWGLLSGRLSALAWVLGAEWDGSLDT